jgi:hypothetical protein
LCDLFIDEVITERGIVTVDQHFTSAARDRYCFGDVPDFKLNVNRCGLRNQGMNFIYECLLETFGFNFQPIVADLNKIERVCSRITCGGTARQICTQICQLYRRARDDVTLRVFDEPTDCRRALLAGDKSRTDCEEQESAKNRDASQKILSFHGIPPKKCVSGSSPKWLRLAAVVCYWGDIGLKPTLI